MNSSWFRVSTAICPADPGWMAGNDDLTANEHPFFGTGRRQADRPKTEVSEPEDVDQWAAELTALRARAQRAIAELAAINERQAELKRRIRTHQERR